MDRNRRVNSKLSESLIRMAFRFKRRAGTQFNRYWWRSGEMILKCSCDHVGQDMLHGKGMRVHNKDKDDKYRCTVCSKEKSSH